MSIDRCIKIANEGDEGLCFSKLFFDVFNIYYFKIWGSVDKKVLFMNSRIKFKIVKRLKLEIA